MSALGQALLINVIVLIAVLEADVGPHRKIGWFRIARPLVLAAAIVPIYLKSLTTHGTGLLGTWMATHHVVSGAITDTLLLMAVGMLLTRTLGLASRAGTLPPAATRDRAHAPVSR
jgi:hypothetical protein